MRLLHDLSAHRGGTGKLHLEVQLSAPTLLQASAVLKFRSEVGHAVSLPCVNAWQTPISTQGLNRGLGVVIAPLFVVTTLSLVLSRQLDTVQIAGIATQSI
eukprot:CAMPEP_0194551448 /NCGR_PEP_ID=MMETSP0253-20130528/96226_1 /TAXON_ID=2966 /ORGANISM="Noctiluca scintillans" /LENGTH=100 /DNA_ID=CAMNT_0039398907 /DNA_START=1184 /DNA_END=1486 /DNA_ORIENTATION=-